MARCSGDLRFILSYLNKVNSGMKHFICNMYKVHLQPGTIRKSTIGPSTYLKLNQGIKVMLKYQVTSW